MSSNDQLVIMGAVTGVTQIYITGTGALSTTVSEIVTATSAPEGSFVIVDNSANSLASFGLKQSGGTFYLYAVPSAIALQPLAVANVTQDMWYQSADIYSRYAASRLGASTGNRTNGLGLWGQIYASSDRYGDRNSQNVFGGTADVDNRVRTNRQGIQAGADFVPGQGQFLVGVTGGYQKAKADPRSSSGGIRSDGYNLGAYARFGGEAGLYGGLMVKADWNKVRLTNSAFEPAEGDPDSRSIGVEGEVGFRWGSGSTKFDVGGQLAYVGSKVDSFSAEGIDYDFNNSTSVRGRLGAQAVFAGSIAPFVSAKLFHEFDGDSRLTLTSGPESDHADGNGRGTWARLEGGIGAQRGAGPMVAAWAEFGDVKGVGLRAGYRF
jgi:outer membrane autotransporter protein